MKNDRQASQFGFSLLELMIVVAITIIVAAISVPAIMRVVANQQLNSSAYAVASMLESARLAAVKTNQPYYAMYNSGGCLNNIVCAVPATGSPNPPDGSNYTSDNPTVTTSGSVSLQNINTVANPPNHNQLDNYLGGGAITPERSGYIGFSGRGVPCMASVATPFVCPQLDPNVGGTPAFEWFMQSNVTGDWVAVTVSPAGRIRTWRLRRQGGNTWQ